MVQFTGKFENYKNENLKDFLLAIAQAQGGDGSKIQANEAGFAASKSTIEITGSGDNYTVNSNHLGKAFQFSFTAGAEFNDTSNNLNLKSVATVSGNKIIIKSTKDGKPAGGRDYEFSDSEVIVSLHAPATPIVAKSYFKRI